MKKNKLPKAQQQIVNNLHWHEEAFIQVAAILNDDKFDYILARPLNCTPLSYKGGKLTATKGLFAMTSIPHHKFRKTIKCLIRKKILIPDLSNKEFDVQVALGTITHRTYRLAKEYR